MENNIHYINLQIMAEILLGGHMLAVFLPHRSRYPLRLAVSSLACLAFGLLFPMPVFADSFMISWGTLMYGSLFLAMAGALWWCYEEPPVSILCCAITGYTIHHLTSAVNEILSGILTLSGITASSAALSLVSLMPVYLVCWRVLSPGIRRTGHIHIDSRRMPYLSGAALLVDVECGLVALKLARTTPSVEYGLLVWILNGIACIFILNLQAGLMSNQTLQTELAIAAQMLEEEKRQYERSQSNIGIINQKCHDLKHQLRTIRHQAGEVDRAVLKEIEQAIEIYDSSTRTGSAPLDVILTEKKLLCESRGITLTCIADGSGLEKISPPDIYALFGNILDNAIEAVCALEDPDGRSISLSVRNAGGMTVIHSENRYSGEISMEDGLPRTRKTDTAYHGFGMRSIRMIAEKYEGHVVVSAEDRIFSLTVTLLPE